MFNLWLIQRGKFKDIKENEITGIDNLISFDYMGSSEFEWGALPKSLKRMLWGKDSDYFGFIEMDDIKISVSKNNKRTANVVVYGNTNKSEDIKEAVRHLSVHKYDYKEFCDFPEWFNNNRDRDARNNFYWDIDNDYMVFWGTEHISKIKKAFDEMKNRQVLKPE